MLCVFLSGFVCLFFLLKCLGKSIKRSCGKEPDSKNLSLTLNFIPAVHVFLQDCPLLHKNDANDSNYIPNAHSGKPASCVEFNRREVEIYFEI